MNGESRPIVGYKWMANAALAMIEQYITNLRKLNAIGMDSVRKIPVCLHCRTWTILTWYKIPDEFQSYEGTHVSGIGERLETESCRTFQIVYLLRQSGTKRAGAV